MMLEGMGVVMALLGVGFNVLGCIGLVRLPDVYNRLQAATKCVTLGTCLVLVGVMLMTESVPCGFKCLVCLAVIAITAPTAAHALARGAHLHGIRLWEGSVGDAYAEDGRPDEAGEEAS
jgi:multicomponent Na+:H+ antiporter subunit G